MKEDRRKRNRGEGASLQLQLRISLERKEAYRKVAGGNMTKWAFSVLDKAAGFNPSYPTNPDKTS